MTTKTCEKCGNEKCPFWGRSGEHTACSGLGKCHGGHPVKMEEWEAVKEELWSLAILGTTLSVRERATIIGKVLPLLAQARREGREEQWEKDKEAVKISLPFIDKSKIDKWCCDTCPVRVTTGNIDRENALSALEKMKPV